MLFTQNQYIMKKQHAKHNDFSCYLRMVFLIIVYNDFSVIFNIFVFHCGIGNLNTYKDHQRTCDNIFVHSFAYCFLFVH